MMLEEVQQVIRKEEEQERIIRQEEDRRFAEGSERCRRSIALHGGPWGGCDYCHELFQEQLKASGGTREDWEKAGENWERHLAFD